MEQNHLASSGVKPRVLAAFPGYGIQVTENAD